MSRIRRLFTCLLSTSGLLIGACGTGQEAPPEQTAIVAEGPDCSIESMRELPDVRITAVTEEAAPVPHCKVAGVIGTETNFELLLPETWNGKFVMGGGGGFVGVVQNTSLMFGSLLKDVRMDLAKRHLIKDGYNVTEVAFMLGYSDSSAFSRAFKSWFGVSPSEFRSTEPANKRGAVDRGL